MNIYPKIDVTVPHKLGAAEAGKRLQNLLLDMQSGKQNPNILLIDFTVVVAAQSLAFTLDVYGTTVHGRVTVAPDYVRIDTDNLPLIAWPVVLYYRGVLQSKLTEALK